MPYCGLNKFIHCFLESSGIAEIIAASLTDPFERRRFGINANGIITYDPIYNEPINLNGQINYLSNIYNGKIEDLMEFNDLESHVGGRPDSEKDYVMILIGKDYDILEGDIIMYPIGSNKSYIVERDMLKDGATKRYIKCLFQVRSTK